jgi:hypothetical protein
MYKRDALLLLAATCVVLGSLLFDSDFSYVSLEYRFENNDLKRFDAIQ